MPNLLGFFIYAVVTSYTPGPNNIMSMANAGRHGFKKTLPFILGIGSGVLVISALAVAFSMTLYSLIPSIKPWLQGVGVAYMLWLAWKTFKYDPDKSDGKTGSNTYLAGVMLQFVNVKVILYLIMITSTYITPYYHTLPALALLTAILSAVSVSSCFCWAGFGSLFNQFVKKHTKAVNVIMALLLVYCAAAFYI